LKTTGLLSEAAGYIPELSYAKEFDSTPGKKTDAKQHQKLSIGDKIKNKIVDAFKSIWEKIKSFIPKIPDGVKDFAGNMVSGLFNMFTSPASAATMPTGSLVAPSAGSADFGAVSGTSGSVAYGGKQQTRLSVAYSPFKSSDIASKGISIISGKGFRQSTGSNHKGYDLPAPQGTPLYAYLPGKILRNERISGYGYAVEWQDSIYKQKHFFAHMMAPGPLKAGQEFQQGALLGQTGDTGTPGSYHLHWEIGGQGSEIDPGQWVNSHPLPQKGPADPAPLNKNKPNVEPTPEPDPGNFLKMLTASNAPVIQQQAPIPIPMPSSGGALTLPSQSNYGSWGLNIYGN